VARTQVTVRLQGFEVQPVEADSYVMDGEALVFLTSGGEIAALFHMSIVEDWEPKQDTMASTDADA
jgi:hypothetical protein